MYLSYGSFIFNLSIVIATSSLLLLKKFKKHNYFKKSILFLSVYYLIEPSNLFFSILKRHLFSLENEIKK